MTQIDACEKNRADWTKAIHRALGDDPPQSAQYTDLHRIIKVLSLFIGNQLNQTLLPNGDRYNMKQVRLSQEEGCLDVSHTEDEYERCRPTKLHFEYFPDSECDSFFLLECGPLDPIFIKEDDSCYEEVVECPDGTFREGEQRHLGYLGCDQNGDELKLPDNSCLVRRYFKGKFLIVANKSLLNLGMELGLRGHNTLTVQEIRAKIQTEINWKDEPCT